jgi:hypothetical protein
MAILGNIIGADATGRSVLGNGRDGVRIRDAGGISLGGIATVRTHQRREWGDAQRRYLRSYPRIHLREPGLGIDLGSSGVTPDSATETWEQMGCRIFRC